MSSNADSQGRAWGTAEEAVRRQAGLDEAGTRPAADNTTTGPSRTIDGQEQVDPATAVGSPPVREDVESIHNEVAGFVDAGETEAKGGTTPPAEN